MSNKRIHSTDHDHSHQPFMRYPFAILIVILPCMAPAVWAQFGNDDVGDGQVLGEEEIHHYQAGLVVRALGGPCRGLFATLPVPGDFPEQQVHVIDEIVTKNVRNVRSRRLPEGVEQLLVSIPMLNNGDMAKVLTTYEITRRAILPPEDTSIYRVPKQPATAIARHLVPSPYIESQHESFRSLGRELVRGKKTAWEGLEAVYDGVRERVEKRGGKLNGAVQALKDGNGNYEDITAVFIALCRSLKVPARTVWVHGYCYAEFYLDENSGQGRWFPCQLVGERAFGETQDTRLILHKGDNFRVPGQQGRQRFVAESLNGKGGGGQPQVNFVRQVLPR